MTNSDDYVSRLKPKSTSHIRLPEVGDNPIDPGDPVAFVFVRSLLNFVTTTTTTNNSVAAFMSPPPNVTTTAAELAEGIDPSTPQRFEAIRGLVTALAYEIDPTTVFELGSASEDARIHIVGMGMHPDKHLTAEAAELIRSADTVLCVATPDEIEQLEKTFKRDIVNLSSESYEEGQVRIDAYIHMATRVLDASMDGTVVLGLYGHPTVFAFPPVLIGAAGRLLGTPVSVIPGISSMATLFADISLDPGVNGLLSYEATDLLLRHRKLLPDVPLLIWQIGSLETVLFSTKDNTGSRLKRFKNYLLLWYPEDHPVVVYCAASSSRSHTYICTILMGEIERHAKLLNSGVTLYIPPSAELGIADTELLGRLTDPAHLQSE